MQCYAEVEKTRTYHQHPMKNLTLRTCSNLLMAARLNTLAAEKRGTEGWFLGRRAPRNVADD